ncbi:MAG: M14 family zinc carboxypeptidase [Bacteroidales bacterium]|nr:M14 family zinc carboxypeptidase [Bacteroidales bacterium]MDD4670452.1 M14 family zinc carboxypeptidase [Bacteroidales bacterium]
MYKKFLIVCFLMLCTASLFAQIQSMEVTQKFYPNPDMTFSTPTLSIAQDRFASYQEIMEWISSRALKDDRMSVEMVGVSSKGREIPMIKLSNRNNDASKIKVWMQGAIHGNEPAGAEGLFMLTDYILNNEAGGKYLDKIDLYILPMANIDGYFADTRASADGYDLNRDQTKFADKESVIIKKAFMAVNPDVAIDFHEFSPIRKEVAFIGEKGGAIYYDVLFLPTGYPNVPKALRKATIKYLQTPAEKKLDKAGYSHFFYFSIDDSGEEPVLAKGAKSPQSSSTSYSLSNAISILVEIRGIKFGRLSLERRTNSVFIVAESALEQTYNHSKAIRKIVDKSINRTIQRRDNISVTGVSSEKRLPVQFVDFATNELVEKNLLVKDALEYKSLIVRDRPIGYIIEKGEEAAIDNLKTLGIDIIEIEEDWNADVESYKVIEYTTAKKSWEKIHRAAVKTEIIKQNKIFPKGSYWIRLNQENANFAVSVLEPESDNGFVTFRVIDTEKGEILPIHRVMK